MVMKSLAGVFSSWGKKPQSGASSKTENGSTTSSTLPAEPKTNEWRKSIREREAAEKVRREKWSKELKQKMNSNTYTYNSAYTVSNSNTNLADSAITINGGPNGSMKVDVPLVVNGRDVMKEIDEMRDALLLLKRDVDMESKYPKLKKIKDEYEAALSKYKTFDAIKESK
jgi:hypothetical protein